MYWKHHKILHTSIIPPHIWVDLLEANSTSRFAGILLKALHSCLARMHQLSYSISSNTFRLIKFLETKSIVHNDCWFQNHNYRILLLHFSPTLPVSLEFPLQLHLATLAYTSFQGFNIGYFLAGQFTHQLSVFFLNASPLQSFPFFYIHKKYKLQTPNSEP